MNRLDPTRIGEKQDDVPGTRGGSAGGLRPGVGGERERGEESDDGSATEHGPQPSRSARGV